MYAMLLDPRFKDHLLSVEKKPIILKKFSDEVSLIHNERNAIESNGEHSNAEVQSTRRNGSFLK